MKTKILFILLSTFLFSSCIDVNIFIGEEEKPFPTAIVKNCSNREIIVQYLSYGPYNYVENDGYYSQMDTIEYVLEPQESFILLDGGEQEGSCREYSHGHHEMRLKKLIDCSFVMVKENNENQDVLRIWTEDDFDVEEKQFYLLRDWEIIERAGTHRNDACLFEIEECDFSL
ncbi:MAG: hypothetical protein IKV46_01790 [Bacteroidales bacterium]|nr:hypothetical protein [Bacteroidales bacterium]